MPSDPAYALVAEHPPAYNYRGGTANLIKTLVSFSGHPFAAMVAADRAGPDPLAGPWDALPTLALFRPKSLLPRLKIGLGLLDNAAFRLQRNRVACFLERQGVERQLAVVANNARFAMLAARLPAKIPRDLYIIDDFVADCAIYKVGRRAARRALERLLAESERVFAISPVYAARMPERYGRPCSFLPLPVADALLETEPAPARAELPSTVILHHSGHIHHLYADALAGLIAGLKTVAQRRGLRFRLELWGNVSEIGAGRALGLDLRPERQDPSFRIEVRGSVDPVTLAAEQRRADFLLLANTFQPRYEDQVMCSFSSKVCEYMVSGVPILLFAPPHSSLSAHLGPAGAAHLIDRPDPAHLCARLDEILSDPDRYAPARRARELARRLHSGRAFFDVLASTFQARK